MNLHGVSAAQSDLRSSCSGKIGELVLSAGLAAGPRTCGSDFRAVVGPNVEGKQRPPQFVSCAYQKLQGFRSLDGTNQVNRRVENSGRIAGFYCSLRRRGKNAGKAG